MPGNQVHPALEKAATSPKQRWEPLKHSTAALKQCCLANEPAERTIRPVFEAIDRLAARPLGVFRFIAWLIFAFSLVINSASVLFNFITRPAFSLADADNLTFRIFVIW